MELLLNIEELSDITNDGWDDTFKKDEEQQIRDVLQMDDVAKVARVNIGPGSDFMTILTVVNTVVETFLIASKLLEGSEAWKKLINKIKGFISKNQLVSINEEGAKILGINYIVEHYSYDSIELVDSHVINIAEVSCKPDASSELAKKPHNYYIQTYCINGEDRLILGVRSDGEVKLIKAFDLSNYGLHELR
jgi:hypothetical protein